MSIIDQKYRQRTIEMIREHWFPKHVAIYQKFVDAAPHENMASEISCLRWCKPGTSNYLVLYFIYGSTLMVTGDLGNAIYRWGQSVSFEWIAKCDFHYFASKLEGIDGSADPRHWDPQVLEKRAASELFESADLTDTRGHNLESWRDFTHSRDEWLRFIWDNIEWFGYDEASSAAELGLVPNSRIMGHWAGLRLAFGLELR